MPGASRPLPRSSGAALAAARAPRRSRREPASAGEVGLAPLAAFVSPCLGLGKAFGCRRGAAAITLQVPAALAAHKAGADPAPASPLAWRDAAAFLFVSPAPAPPSPPQAPCPRTEAEDEDDAAWDESPDQAGLLQLCLGPDVRLPLRLQLMQQAAMLLPSAMAAHHGLLGGQVAMACMPLPVLFSVPMVGPDSWLANKRARAFHRACVVCVYAQGAFAILKFARGDLIGGVYDAVMCAMGAYAVDADGIRLMPSYIMICGFNGVLGLMHILQQFQGAPIHYLPLSLVLPPVIAISAAYFGWQFCREIRAIATGLLGDGPQDTCFVRTMGGDWWPESIGAQVNLGGREGSVATPSRFNPFAGDGRRLGHE